MSGSHGGSRKKNFRIPFIVKLIITLFIIVVFFITAGSPLLQRWLPSREYKDLNEWFEVDGVNVKIYLDTEPEHEYTGIYYNGEVYLPYEYIYNELNERFYWNDNEKLLTYTLPDEVIDYEADSSDNIILSEDIPYISLNLVAEYTNISYEGFLTDAEGFELAAKRVFIYVGGTSYDSVNLTRNAKLRTYADKKAPILTDLKKGDKVFVTDTMKNYSRVVTGTGFVGYAANSVLPNSDEFEAYVVPDTYTEPESIHLAMDEKVVMGWHATYSKNANDNLEGLYEGTDKTINVISPQWLQISSADGDMVDYSDADYIARAHELGLEVWVSVDNINQPGGINDFSTKDFFADTENRRRFISELMDKAETYGYDGFNLDFEGLPQDAGQSYTQFFRELSVACHERGLKLSIDNYVPYDYNSYYNLSEQAYFADYVVIMGYNEYTGGDMGPVSSIGYIEYGITEALKLVPEEKLIMALPLYTRVWRISDGVTTSEAMGISESEQYVSDNAIMLSWDEEVGAYYGETMIGSGQISLWLEENESLKLKVDKIMEYGLAGLAVWRLGLEPKDVWEVLDINSY